jgi:hypothetical protein
LAPHVFETLSEAQAFAAVQATAVFDPAGQR